MSGVVDNYGQVALRLRDPTPQHEPGKSSHPGARIADVVIELEQSPALIQKLHEDWNRLGDRVVVGEEILGILDRMSAARLIDDEVVAAIWNNRPEGLRAYVDAKLGERRQARRGRG